MTTTTTDELEHVDELDDVEDQADELAELPDELGWLRLVPSGLIDAGYVTRALERLQVAERHSEVSTLLAEWDERARDLVAGGCSPLDFARSSVVAEAAGLRAFAARLPAIPPRDSQDEIVAELLGQRVPVISAGPPPLYAAEMLHHLEAHSQDRSLPPAPFGHDLEVLGIYETLAAATPDVWRTAQAFRVPLNGSELRHRVESWHAWTTGGLVDWLRAVELVAGHVADHDRRRIESGRAHACRLWSGAHCSNLDPPAGSDAWTLAEAAAGRFPHRPVTPRR